MPVVLDAGDTYIVNVNMTVAVQITVEKGLRLHIEDDFEDAVNVATASMVHELKTRVAQIINPMLAARLVAIPRK